MPKKSFNVEGEKLEDFKKIYVSGEMNTEEMAKCFGTSKYSVRELAKKLKLGKKSQPQRKKNISAQSSDKPKTIAEQLNEIMTNDLDIAKWKTEISGLPSKGLSEKEADVEMRRLIKNIFMKAIGVAPNGKEFFERLADYQKLLTNDKKASGGKDEEDPFDVATLEKLKKQFIMEALKDIRLQLTETEQRMFQHCLEAATQRVVEAKRKVEEEQQKKALETAGYIESEIVK